MAEEFDWSIANETAEQVNKAMDTIKSPSFVAAQIPGTPYCVTKHSADLSTQDTVFMAASALASEVRTVEQRDELVAMFTDTFITLADSAIEVLSKQSEREQDEE